MATEARRPRRRWRRRILIALAATVLTAPLAPVVLVEALARLQSPGAVAPPPSSVQIVDRNGVRLATLASRAGGFRETLPLTHMGPHLPAAIVAVEDARFFEHGGVDWTSAFGAAWSDLASLRIKRGASTLSMQLYRLREPRARSFLGKLEQAVRGKQLDAQLGKQGVLEAYLNEAPFGGNLVGAASASRFYFGVEPERLSLAQAALLAGIPQAPNRLRPDRFPQKALARRDVVLQRMLDTHTITREQFETATHEPLTVVRASLPQEDPAHAAALPALTESAARTKRCCHDGRRCDATHRVRPVTRATRHASPRAIAA
ncbi:MAG: transglycosylase domain-containing protein [Tepidisphaeraceae bacterium]